MTRKKKRVMILGLDGFDPKLSEKWMDSGLLPNFSRLRQTGTFSPLTVTNPPETAASWSAFSTGQNPGKTGIFDFIIRDPKTYTLLPGMVSLVRRDSKTGELVSARRGTSLWKLLGDRGLHSTVLNMPVTYPAEVFNGRMLSGMGTPDVLGSVGRAAYYSTGIKEAKPRFTIVEVAIEVKDGVVETVLNGPNDQTIPLRFEINPENQGGKAFIQGQNIELETRVLSEWCEVRFSARDEDIFGLCRFCLLTTEPEIEIYCSPIQSHPGKPHISITHPPSFASELYADLGPFRTMGREVDIFNLQEGVIDDDVLLTDTFLAMKEREMMTRHILNQAQDDLIISWIGVVDTTQHGYWRFVDTQHPLYTEEGARKYGDTVQKVYQWLDGMVGRLMETMGDDTMLIIVSDHGGGNWRRAVNFNTWLWKEGYLVMEGVDVGDPSSYMGISSLPFTEIDWAKTRAYAVGCGKIYLNLRGREGKGIVLPGSEAIALENDLIEQLNAWEDPEKGVPVVSQVYRSREVQWGSQMFRAPDLIVGLNDGYRISWDSRSMVSLEEPLTDNTGKISGDHISMDYKLVPGTLMSNLPLDLSRKPHILDIAPTVLDFFKLEIPEELDGESLLP